jgi:hypothetical protein
MSCAAQVMRRLSISRVEDVEIALVHTGHHHVDHLLGGPGAGGLLGAVAAS